MTRLFSPLLIFILLVMLPALLSAQVKIGGTPGPPVSSAVLELDGGGTKGMRLPIVNTKEELADIPNPVNGLMVYATYSGSVAYYHNGSWYELKEAGPTFTFPHAGNYDYTNTTVLQVSNTANMGRGIQSTTFNGFAFFGNSSLGKGLIGQTNAGTALEGLAASGIALNLRSESGTTAKLSRGNFAGNVLVTDTGRIGFGTSTPGALVEIDATHFGGFPLRVSGVNPSVEFKHDGALKSYIRQSASQLTIGTQGGINNDRIAIINGGTRRITINPEGRVGIGENAEQWTGVLNIKSALDGPGLLIDTDEPEVRFRAANADKTKMGWKDNILTIENVGSHNILFKTNNVDRLQINGSSGNTFIPGRLGVGAEALAARFTVDAVGHASTETVTINDEAPTIQLRASGTAVGFMQLNGNDLRIGTNAGIADGRVVMRTGGVDRFFLNSAGNGAFPGTLSVGTTEVATGYLLNVRGRIIGEEIRIQNFASWPDYVFDPTYKLPDLKELAGHISTHHHLPGIPSASEVAANGFDVGFMEAKLLEKVEELTLYLLQANKRIDEMEKALMALSKKTSKTKSAGK